MYTRSDVLILPLVILLILRVQGGPLLTQREEGEGEPTRNRAKRETDKLSEDKDFWLKEGVRELEESLGLKPNEGLAKNIVIVVGDGMSLPTISAARVYKGQKQGLDGASTKLVWENFPHFGLSKTYSTNSLVPDSSSTAFAMFSGVKTNYNTVGFDNSVEKGNPFSALTAKQVDTVLQWAQEAGMTTGIVTNTRVTHATPSALFAKTVNRDWECDRKMPVNKPEEVKDISHQLVYSTTGANITVVLGGGRGSFTPAQTEEELLLFSPHPIRFNSGYSRFDCSRLDGEDLVEKWREINPRGKFVQTKSEMLTAGTEEAEKLLGLFSWSYMPFDDELNSTLDIPSLTDMTNTALSFLQSKNTGAGFFLMVEGGRIDHAHHDGQAVRALSETVAMDRAVSAILEKVNLTDTLVLVTADHSHTMTMGGYPGRSADVTGIVQGDDGWIMNDLNGQPFPILSYANGPGFKSFRVKEESDLINWQRIERSNIPGVGEGAGFSYQQPSAVPLKFETHGGDDVGIWGAGPMAHLLHATHQQTFIGHLMSLAGCIGPHKNHPRCDRLHR